MNLKWTERSETGETILRESFPINMDNVGQHARKNCKNCFSKGYLEVDSGSRRFNGEEIKFNPRVVTCNCVDNHLAKIEKLKDQK